MLFAPQTGRLFGLLGITRGLFAANTPRRVSWLGRSVTTKTTGCDPKCPKIGQSSMCCRSQSSDDSCLLTDPANFWFPGNIFHHPIKLTHRPVDDEYEMSDISDDGSSD